MTVVIEHARVLTLDDDEREFDDANIVVEGDRIAAVGPGAQPMQDGPDVRRIDARGMLAMPGLVNGHFHSPGNFMNGALADMPLELFMLYEVPPLARGLAGDGARLAYVQTLLGAAEMLKLGVTAVHDDPYHTPEPSTDTIDAIMQAYDDSGLRATVSINYPNRVEYDKYPFLRDLLPADVRSRMDTAPQWSAARIGDLYRWFHGRWHGAAGGRLRIAVSNSAPQRVTDDYFATLSGFSRAHDLPFDIHMLETRLQRVFGDQVWGESLIQHVRRLGLLDRRMLVIHAIWIDEADIDALAEAGCTVAHNPVCNLKIGSGIMPFRRLRDRGIPVALGTDERNTDDTTNVWGAMKTAALVHRLTDPDDRQWPTAAEVLRCATRGGARGMGLADAIGCIAPGRAADLILVDLDTFAFTPLNDLRRQLVFSENGSSVRMTMVAGRVVVENGRLTTVDEPALRAEARALHAAQADAFRDTDAAARALEPYYREMILRASHTPVGMQRRAGPTTP
jgi:cytosine/adenosine deaminase-related metal-dependent hydrolase